MHRSLLAVHPYAERFHTVFHVVWIFLHYEKINVFAYYYACSSTLNFMYMLTNSLKSDLRSYIHAVIARDVVLHLAFVI